MSFDKFQLRKSLYMIGQNMGKRDVSNLKFLCDYDLPKRQMEKIETAFELFCALEDNNLIDYENDLKLKTILQSINKAHLLDRHPLGKCDSVIQTDRGGKIPETAELRRLNTFLVGISDNMSHRDLRTFACFVYDQTAHFGLMDLEKVESAHVLFNGLIEDRLIGPKNLSVLEEIFEVIGRNDLHQKVREYLTSVGHPVMTTDHQTHDPYNLSMSSQSSSGSNSFRSSSVSSPSTDSTPDPSLQSHHRVSLDHGTVGVRPSAPPPPQNPTYHPQQPVANVQQHPISQYPASTPIFHGPTMVAPVQQQQRSDLSLSVTSNPYAVEPETESLEQPNESPKNPVPPVDTPIAEIGGREHNFLVAKPNNGLIAELKVKENELKASDHAKAQLFTTIEYQREVIEQLMQASGKRGLQVASQPPPAKQLNVQQPPTYPMDQSPHGLAVILGNQTFLDNPNRPRLELSNRKGCDVDVENFKNIFAVLKYEVSVHKDYTAAEIEELFKNIASMDHSKYDSFVLCITSHGESNNYIFGSDSDSCDIYQLIHKIQGCMSLQNKPKLFFIQACRLAPEDMVSRDSGGKTSLSYNSEADVYIAWATSRDQPAYRSPSDGSWFVGALKHVFAAQAPTTDLVTMMYGVTDIVSSAEGHEKGSSTTVQQCVETSSQLRGAVRFFP